MLNRKILGAASVTTSILLGGCSGDMGVNSVVSSSPEVLRDCDRLGMKVLLASYEKAGENQGRLVGFHSSSETSVKGELKLQQYEYTEAPTRKGNSWISGGSVLLYGLFYYVDDNGKPAVYKPQEPSSKVPEEKFFNQYRIYTRHHTFFTDSGKDWREEVKTGDSLTCKLNIRGEGDVETKTYTISEDKNSIYWREN